jgi:hypothetical protein
MTEEKKQQNPKERDDKGQLVKGHQANLEHGGWVWLRHGKCPSVRGRRRIMRELSELRQRLLEVVPGSDDVRRQILINQVVSAQGFVLLLESFLKRFGILDPKSFQQGQVQTQGSMVMIISLLNTQQRAIAALGMDKRELEAVLTPYEIVDREKSK